MNPFRRIQHEAEYIGARVGLALVDAMSVAAAGLFADMVGDAFFLSSRARRAIACGNVLKAGIAATPADARRIARASFRHFARVVIESLKSDRLLTADTWRDRVELDVPAETMDLLARPGQGLILVSGHVGNWEIAAQVLSFLKPVTGITRGFANPRVDRIMQERKPRNRFTLTPKHDADTGRFLQVLGRGEILALLIDQHARQGGVAVPFLGRPASTYPSPALLHLVTRAPLCFGACMRTGPMRFRLSAPAPVRFARTGNREADVRAILETLTVELEKVIRAHPEQYLWAHRRWRLDGAAKGA